jgi:hypothetical protein
MRVKGPHNYMVMALGLCVKWPLDTLISFLNLLHVIKKPNLKKITVIRLCTSLGLVSCDIFFLLELRAWPH